MLSTEQGFVIWIPATSREEAAAFNPAISERANALYVADDGAIIRAERTTAGTIAHI